MRLTATRVLRFPAEAATAKSYSATLKLPKSSFPPRPPVQQPSCYLPAVTDELYQWNVSRHDAATTGTFVLHDGPPYANGSLHVGHAVNKILKDVVNRFWLGQGKKVKYVPGWDCHGLPIEIKALKGRSGDGMGAIAIRKAARALAEATVKQQMGTFKSWAVMGDWDGAYRTMDTDFEMRQLEVFKRLVQKGLIYRRHKPVYWSPSSRTALAESELEYMDDHRSTAAFVAYKIEKPPPSFSDPTLLDDVYAVIWTTTPWTLPANRAIAIHEGLSYCIVEATTAFGRQQKLLVEESRLDSLQVSAHLQSCKIIVSSIGGSDLVGAAYRNPLSPGTTQPIVHADFVSSASGTGLVHMAPGHGMDDYEVCLKLGIDAVAPVDDRGCFTDAALPSDPSVLSGKNVQGDGVTAVLDHLKHLGDTGSVDFVLGTHQIRHRYPIDWRTKLPVIVRATEQWFADVDLIKDDAISALQNVKFMPAAGRSRLESFTRSRSQWCVSRQRAWGVPIPALYRVDDGSRAAYMSTSIIDHIIGVLRERGTDAWWTDPEDDPRWVPSDLEGTYVRGKDTMDVWFDSGTTWTMLDQRPDGGPVADVYLEGTDQHRGWFQSSLLTHVADQSPHAGGKDRGNQNIPTSASPVKAPFKTLITHGFTLDADGRKMSKSLGNVIGPDQIMQSSRTQTKGKGSTNMGADALRLWVASNDYTTDIIIGQQALENNHKALQKYRITFKWLLGCLSDFKPTSFASWRPADACLADRMALHQLSATALAVHTAYQTYEFFKAAKAIESYVHTDLSAFYFESAKDRVYAGLPDDRRDAQAVLHCILVELLSMLGPITPLMVEEVWQHLPDQLRQSVHPLRAVWNPYQPPWASEAAAVAELEGQRAEVSAIHEAVKIAAERARSDGKMGTSLDCDVEIYLPAQYEPPTTSVLRPGMLEDLASLLVVSDVKVLTQGLPTSSTEKPNEDETWSYAAALELQGSASSANVVVRCPKRHKCPRCWKHTAYEKDHLCTRCNEAISVS